MKFSVRQILASAAGAVIAAVIASSFGIAGTIIGVAIGSIAATTCSALVSQSIERGHKAVKQVAVKAPESSTLLRRLGGTRVSPGTTTAASSAPTQAVGRSTVGREGSADTGQMESAAAPVGATDHLEISAETDAPPTELLRASSTPMRPTAGQPGVQRFSWRAILATAAIVFALALLFITAVELISGQPFASIFGGSESGTTVQNLVNPSSPATTVPTTSTTTTTTISETTTTTSETTTTSTTAPRSNATTTTQAPATTTTTGVGATTTSTTAPATVSP